MSNISIFNQDVPDFLKGGVNELTKSLAGNTATGGKRISIRGGVFRKVVSGKEVAKVTGRELNVIIVNASKSVSRVFYAGKYNPDEIVPPTCVSNDGVTPDTTDDGRQSSSCNSCPQNIAGSGNGNSRACKYTRRLAVVLEGDMSGDVYQLQLAATSIFGKGDGNMHPFESYVKYIAGNGRNINQIVTQMTLDTDSDTPKLLFSPVRHISAEEWEISDKAGSSLEAKNAITMSAGQTDGVKKALLPPAKPQVKFESDEVIAEPVKRVAKKAEQAPTAPKPLGDVISAWADIE